MVDRIEELALEARHRALEKIYVWRAGERVVQSLLANANLSPTFCLQSGALVVDGCNEPAHRILDTLSIGLDEIDDQKLLPAIGFVIDRAEDEGRAISRQHFQGFDFVTIMDEAASRPTAFMQNNAAEMPKRILDDIAARRTLAYAPVEQVMRSERFISSGADFIISHPTDPESVARRAAADAATANFVMAALAELPKSACRETLFKTHRDVVFTIPLDTGHNGPAARMLWAGKQAAIATDGFEAGRDMESLWLAHSFKSVVDAAAEMGRAITQYPVGGSTFLKIGPADSEDPRGFGGQSPALAI